MVTDLRTDVGHFAQPGAPVMTLIAIHDLWISADLTENNIGHVHPGDRVAIVLDVMPGEVLKDACAPSGAASAAASESPPDRCRRWRTAATGCARRSASRWRWSSTRGGVQAEGGAGGQADVLVYTGDHPLMNPLGALYMRVVSR